MYVLSSLISTCAITLAIVPINAADLKRLAFPENEEKWRHKSCGRHKMVSFRSWHRGLSR